jgi:hypothetical protein
MLLPPIGKLVLFVVPDALLNLALLNGFAYLFLKGVQICKY